MVQVHPHGEDLVPLESGVVRCEAEGVRLADLEIRAQSGVVAIATIIAGVSLLGFVLAPIAWLIGVPWGDAVTVGGLIGEKVVLNEFVAYAHLSEIKATLSPQAALISTYALCGFANFSSIAIQIGGIGGIAPERRADLARFGLKAVLGGSLATFMTATIAGVLGGL